jgi:hypothetical protein
MLRLIEKTSSQGLIRSNLRAIKLLTLVTAALPGSAPRCYFEKCNFAYQCSNDLLRMRFIFCKINSKY